MLYNYNEILKKYGSDYNIKKAICNNFIFKIEKGLYSDKKNVHYLDIIYKKYPYAVITGESAYYYYNLTDVIPSRIILCTDRHSTRINDPKIKQIFASDDLFKVGITTIKYEGSIVNIYDKERLLIELARKKNSIPYDLYKELIMNYRELANSINMRKLQKHLSHFHNADKLFEILQNEVF